VKWHKTIETPSGRGLLVDFESGETLTIAKGIDDHLHIVSSSPEGVAFAIAASGALVVAPRLRAAVGRTRERLERGIPGIIRRANKAIRNTTVVVAEDRAR
jgi:hypothetical protein